MEPGEDLQGACCGNQVRQHHPEREKVGWARTVKTHFHKNKVSAAPGKAQQGRHLSGPWRTLRRAGPA